MKIILVLFLPCHFEMVFLKHLGQCLEIIDATELAIMAVVLEKGLANSSNEWKSGEKWEGNLGYIFRNTFSKEQWGKCATILRAANNPPRGNYHGNSDHSNGGSSIEWEIPCSFHTFAYWVLAAPTEGRLAWELFLFDVRETEAEGELTWADTAYRE